MILNDYDIVGGREGSNKSKSSQKFAERNSDPTVPTKGVSTANVDLGSLTLHKLCILNALWQLVANQPSSKLV